MSFIFILPNLIDPFFYEFGSKIDWKFFVKA